MKRYKLKKEVKEVLVFGVVTAAVILMIAIFAKSSKQAYEECLIQNNNDINFCHRLIEW